jgi:hypothetical protein
MILLCFGVAFLQSQEYIDTDFYMEEYPTETRWNEVPFKTLRNWVYLHAFGVIAVIVAKVWSYIWDGLGAL